MIEIMSLFVGLTPCLTPTVQRQLARIVEAMLSMTGRAAAKQTTTQSSKESSLNPNIEENQAKI